LLYDNGISFVLETNGTLLTEDAILEFVPFKDNAFFSVSLDGPNAIINSLTRRNTKVFEKTVYACKIIKRYDIPFEITMSINKNNYKYIEEMIIFCVNIGCKILKLNYIVSVGNAKKLENDNVLLNVAEIMEIIQDYDIYREKYDITIIDSMPPMFHNLKYILKYKNLKCIMPKSIGLLPNGDLGICGLGFYSNDFIYGNIEKDDLLDVLNSSSYRRTMQKLNSPYGICKSCILFSHCKGNCVALGFYINQSIISGNPFCEQLAKFGLFNQNYLKSLHYNHETNKR
jgi:radical SAM protein with 4Fe4S-binding SPASM domain